MRRHILLTKLFALALFPSMASAQEQKSLTILDSTIPIYSDELSNQSIANFFTSLSDNQEIFAKLPSPKTTAVKIFASNQNVGSPAYELISHNLMLHRAWCNNDYKPKPAEYSAIAFHEFSHSVFDSNLKITFPNEYENFARIEREYTLAILTGRALTPEEQKASFTTLSMPYDELFADTAAALADGNGDVLSHFIENCNGEPGKRDFTKYYPVAGWNVGPLGGRKDRKHELFDPTRSIIWTLFKDRCGGLKENRSTLLNAVARASLREIDKLQKSNTTRDQWRDINQETLNANLIQGITEELGDQCSLQTTSSSIDAESVEN